MTHTISAASPPSSLTQRLSRDVLLLLLWVGLAVGLRLVAIGRESLWFDEAVSYLTATLPVPAILNNTVQSSHPPLYYLLLHFWRDGLPDSDAALRLLGLAWNVLTIPAIFGLSLELFASRRLAHWAAFLVAISPFHLLYSHELRMYTQLMCLVVLAAFAYLRARRSQGWLWWLAFALISLAAVYTHLFAFLALAAIGLHALIHRQDQGALWRTIAVGIFLGLAFLPWASLLLAESQKELGSMRPLAQPAPLNPIKPLTSLAFLLFGMSSNNIYSALAFFLTLAAVIVFVLEARKARRENNGPSTWLLPALMVLCVAGLPVALYLVRPFFLPERTLAAASPFLLLLLAWGTTRHQSPLPYLVYASAGVMFTGSLFYLSGSLVKPPYREAMALLDQHVAAGDVVLHTSDGSYLPALRYVDWNNHAVLAGDPDPRKPAAVYHALGGEVWTLEQAETAGHRLWLVVALEHSLDWQIEQSNLVAARYPELAHYEVGDIQLLLYDLAQPRE